MKRRRFAILLLAATLAGAGECGSIDPSSREEQGDDRRVGQLSGIVADASTGVVIANATVRVEEKTAATDSAGRFLLHDLTAGAQTLTVEAQGYVVFSKQVTVAEGANALGTLHIIPVVRLVYATGYNYGCSSCWGMRAVFEVESSPQEQEVALAYQWGITPWEETPGSYLRSPTPNVDLYVAEVRQGESHFSIRYTVAGREYRDDNQGRNYHFKMESLQPRGMVLGNGRSIAVVSASESGDPPLDAVFFTTLVRNRASSSKQVGILYSTDHWATTGSRDFDFGQESSGDVELWTGLLPIDTFSVKSFDFVAFVTQSGETAWDATNGQETIFHCQIEDLAWFCKGGGLVDARFSLPQ